MVVRVAKIGPQRQLRRAPCPAGRSRNVGRGSSSRSAHLQPRLLLSGWEDCSWSADPDGQFLRYHWSDGSGWRTEGRSSPSIGHSSTPDHSFRITALLQNPLSPTELLLNFCKTVLKEWSRLPFTDSGRHDTPSQLTASAQIVAAAAMLCTPPRNRFRSRGNSWRPGANGPVGESKCLNISMSSVLISAQNAVLPYPKLQRNLELLRRRLGRPLVLSEKILYT